MSRWSLVGAWVAVALVATTLTWQIVSAADAQVNDRPVAPLQVGAPVVTAAESTTITSAPTTSSAEVSQAGSSTSTTTPTSSSSSTTAQSTSSTATSPSPTAAENWMSQTIPTGGGVVVISHRSGEVVLSSATPTVGFATEIKNSGPSEVDVEFESESAKYRVRAKWENGQLAVETDVDVG